MTITKQPGSDSKSDVAIVGVAYFTAILAALGVGSLLSGHHPLFIVAVVDVVATLVVFGFSVVCNNSSIYDPYWSIAPVPIALFFAFGQGGEGEIALRQVLVLVLVSVWALRLTYNWLKRWRGLNDEDWRYVNIRDRTGAYYWPASFFGIHLLPTVVVFLGCLPLFSALASSTRPFGLLDVVALIVTAGAIAIETTADAQLRRFLANGPASTDIMSSGLWAWSRHPNYFGEVLYWWGIFLFGLAAAPASGLWIWLGPAAMTGLFFFISIPMMDRRMVRLRPRYAERMTRVSSILPWPPRREG